MNIRSRTKIAGGVVAAVAAIVIGIGVTVSATGATGGDENEAPISGSALDQASAAALAHTGEGRVSDTEAGDEESLYEVEVTLDDGSEVDVQLDADFNVVGSEAEDPDENEAAGDASE